MTKSDVLFIISHIYCVGGLIVEGKRGYLYTLSTIWLLMAFIVWVGE